MKFSTFIFLCTIILASGCKKQSLLDYYHPMASKDSLVVAIVPFHDINPELIHLASVEIEQFYGVKTNILEAAYMPDSCRRPYALRYNANKILEYLMHLKPSNADYILALTSKGIATKKGIHNEWGILGLGANPGPCCVISTANMGLYENCCNDRFIKVCLHEMGHNFGLPHCTSGDKKCLMRDANGTIKTIDEEEKYLCNYCFSFLKYQGFNPKQKDLAQSI